MSVTMLSDWEVRTHGQAALRVLGVPFGASERAMELLVWAHAVQGGAIEYLIEQQHTIADRATAPLTVTDEGAHDVRIDANGQAIFTAGPAIIDLACSLVGSERSSVRADGVIGCEFAAELAHRGAAHGFATTVTTPIGGWAASPASELRRNDQTSDALTVICSHDGAPVGEPLDVSRRIAAALRHGYQTDTAASAAFLDLGHRLWLPTSPRSRAQGSEGDKA